MGIESRFQRMGSIPSRGIDSSFRDFFSSTKLIYGCLSKSYFGLALVVRTSQDRLGSVNSRGVRGRDNASPVIDLSVSPSPQTQTSQWQSSTKLDWDNKISPGIFWSRRPTTTSGGKSTEKHTQVKVPLPSKKCVSRVKALVQKTTWVRVKV